MICKRKKKEDGTPKNGNPIFFLCPLYPIVYHEPECNVASARTPTPATHQAVVHGRSPAVPQPSRTTETFSPQARTRPHVRPVFRHDIFVVWPDENALRTVLERHFFRKEHGNHRKPGFWPFPPHYIADKKQGRHRTAVTPFPSFPYPVRPQHPNGPSRTRA